MARVELRLPENAAGDFYVDSSCIDCDLCRQIASETFRSAGEQSVVYRQPEAKEEILQALKALVTCPTASIGTLRKHAMREAVAAYPETVEGEVHFCGFAAESSYGASSYLIVRPEGNVLVDSPRFARPLAERIGALGGIGTIFLTHRDDVADHALWARRFSARRILHRADAGRAHAGIERLLDGCDPIDLAPDLRVIPTPGHTPGHAALLYRGRFLFAGDHLRWSDALGSLTASADVCWYSWSEQIRSMEKLREYEFEWVLPGHGRRAHADAAGMQRHLEACIERMKRQRA